jgi:hypothetical protein
MAEEGYAESPWDPCHEKLPHLTVASTVVVIGSSHCNDSMNGFCDSKKSGGGWYRGPMDFLVKDTTVITCSNHMGTQARRTNRKVLLYLVDGLHSILMYEVKRQRVNLLTQQEPSNVK